MYCTTTMVLRSELFEHTLTSSPHVFTTCSTSSPLHCSLHRVCQHWHTRFIPVLASSRFLTVATSIRLLLKALMSYGVEHPLQFLTRFARGLKNGEFQLSIEGILSYQSWVRLCSFPPVLVAQSDVSSHKITESAPKSPRTPLSPCPVSAVEFRLT